MKNAVDHTRPEEKPDNPENTDEEGTEASEAPSARSVSASSSDAGSDAEDVFNLAVASEDSLSEEYRNLFLYRWQRAATELAEQHLRNDLLLPLNPTRDDDNEVWNHVDQGVALPIWHCGFRGCKVTACNGARAESDAT